MGPNGTSKILYLMGGHRPRLKTVADTIASMGRLATRLQIGR